MIRIFEQGHEDFSSMGLGEIQPLSCVVREEQGGAYELEIEMAMDEQTRYDRLLNGRVLQVPVPAMTTPLIKTLDVTVTEFWRTNGSVKLYSKKTDVMGTNQTVTVPAQYAPDEVGTGFVLIRAAYSETSRKRSSPFLNSTTPSPGTRSNPVRSGTNCSGSIGRRRTPRRCACAPGHGTSTTTSWVWPLRPVNCPPWA